MIRLGKQRCCSVSRALSHCRETKGDGLDSNKISFNGLIQYHDSFFNDRAMVLLIKVIIRVDDSFNDSTLPTDFNWAPYFMTNVWNSVENFMLFAMVVPLDEDVR